MSRAIEAAEELLEHLRGLGIAAVDDVRDVAGNLPCVLIGPPVVRYDVLGGPTFVWSLVALASSSPGSKHAWQQCDALLDQLDAALPLERADPRTYPLPALGPDPLPCYVATYTGS